MNRRLASGLRLGPTERAPSAWINLLVISFLVLFLGVGCGDSDRLAADAGPDQDVETGALVTLEGGANWQPQGGTVDYSWYFVTTPNGSAAVLSDPTAESPTFTADLAGTYVIALVVSYEEVIPSPPDMVLVTAAGNSAPVADAGADQNVSIGATVALDGTGSSDANGDPLTYAWTLATVPGGSFAVLSDATASMPTFVADIEGTYEVTLVVDDGAVSSTMDTVFITAGNSAPVADAGPNQSVSTGATVTLDGSGSTDNDGDLLTYAWALSTIPGGSSAVLSDATATMPTFVADIEGIYVASLVVDDGLISSTENTVQVTATTGNVAPVAYAGPDQNVSTGAPVTLDGSGSSDANGDVLTLTWGWVSAPGGSGATLSDVNATMPTFVPDVDGTYILELQVYDGALYSAFDVVEIVATTSGQRVVYIADQETNGTNELYVGTVTGQTPFKVSGDLVSGGDVQGGWGWKLSPDGNWIVFRADKDTDNQVELYVVPVAGGVVTKLNDPLPAGGLVGGFQITPDSNTVVFMLDPNGDYHYELYSTPIDGTGAVTLIEDASNAGAALSRFDLAGNTMVVYKGDLVTDGVNELYSNSILGGARIKIDNVAGLVNNPIHLVTPDGSRVIYSTAPSVDNRRLVSTLVSTGAATTLDGPFDSGGIVETFRISADSSRVVYRARPDSTTPTQLLSVPIDGSDSPVELGAGATTDWYVGVNSDYVIDPTSSTVAFRSDRDTDNWFEIYTVDIHGATLPVKVSGASVSGGNSFDFYFSPDGSRVVFGGDLETDGVEELFSAPIDGSSRVKLNDTLAGNQVDWGNVTITPDSSRVVYRAEQDRATYEDLYSVPIVGGATVKLNDPIPNNSSVFSYKLSPNGAMVLYRAVGTVTPPPPGGGDPINTRELFSVPTAGGSVVKVNGEMVTRGEMGQDYYFAP